MAWSDLIDQQRVIEVLRRTVARERVAHAYLFIGPDGVGKRAVALEFAKTLLCERGGDEACGRCLACTKVSRMLHPDIHVLFPYPSDAGQDDVNERVQRLGENPYAAIDFVRRPSLSDPTKKSNKQAFYPVARINEEVRRAVSFKPVEGRYKVVIITDADVLRIEAANAFLKLLEEPASQTVFVLTTSRPDRLLPTIVSRCQRLRFDPLAPEAIEKALVEREGLPADVAGMTSRMADGSYSRALDLSENEELMESRQVVLEFFRLSYARKVDQLADVINQVGGLGRERVKGVLGLMLRWMRDLLLYRTMGEEAPLINVDQIEAIARFCNNLPDADLDAMVRLVEEAMELIERNVHTALTLTVLSQALGRAMRGPHSGKLYLPLASLEEVSAA